MNETKGSSPNIASSSRAPVTTQTFGESRQCPQCGCTERDPYNRGRSVVLTPTESSPWTHRSSKRCKCKACGTRRIDHYYEVRIIPEESNDAKIHDEQNA
ncbi:hypothetical protein CA85_40370 [Allorhodopirellula solitaria]|uniref:Uncharacterized protein n=1 Tax=Allorhodopirellula solitaria TaxID=2527987 RepID=A0A5C5X0N1_9BACT|nr:hypothetical protein CA85_40370 [Allorhodopirellula solitaria]